MSGTIPPFPHYVFMAWCLVKDMDSFTFTMLKKMGPTSTDCFSDEAAFHMCVWNGHNCHVWRK
jgi:hypothetical protein